jgi:hypothetical protein
MDAESSQSPFPPLPPIRVALNEIQEGVTPSPKESMDQGDLNAHPTTIARRVSPKMAKGLD